MFGLPFTVKFAPVVCTTQSSTVSVSVKEIVPSPDCGSMLSSTSPVTVTVPPPPQDPVTGVIGVTSMAPEPAAADPWALRASETANCSSA
jgi:hypothetical protein